MFVAIVLLAIDVFLYLKLRVNDFKRAIGVAMKYDDIDFLEFFDVVEDVDRETGYVTYKVSSKEGMVLYLFMNVYEDTAHFRLETLKNASLVTFSLFGVAHVMCDRDKSGLVRFVFYQRDKEEPSLVVIVKPDLELILNL
jgi:hypothetical protein